MQRSFAAAAASGAALVASWVLVSRRLRRQRSIREADLARFASAGVEFRERGFVVVRSLLEPEDLLRLRREVASYIQEVVPTKSRLECFYDKPGVASSLKYIGQLQERAFFRDIRQHPR